MAAPVCILIPPSEGKAADGEGPPRSETGDGAFPALAESRAALVAALDPAIDGLPTMAAIERYSGVLCTAMSYATLPARLRRRADNSVVIVSGLWGALAPTDPIPDYKLAMTSRLEGFGGLAPWWRPRLSPVIDSRVDAHVVWDLLPSVHAGAWDEAAARYRARWRVRVLREGRDGTRTTVSHDNKATKGHLARHLIEAAARTPEDLVGLELPGGYRVDTSNTNWTKRGGLVEIVQSWRA